MTATRRAGAGSARVDRRAPPQPSRQARNALTPGLLTADRRGRSSKPSPTRPSAPSCSPARGDRAFCAGMDLQSFADGEAVGTGDDEVTRRLPPIAPRRGLGPHRRRRQRVCGRRRVGAPARMRRDRGLRRHATFGFPEVKRGLFAGRRRHLDRHADPLGHSAGADAHRRLIDAHARLRGGLDQRRRPARRSARSAAVAFAERIAENGSPRLAATKELVRLSVSDAARAEVRLDEWRSAVFTSDDAREGAMAFVEKRAPVWRGR